MNTAKFDCIITPDEHFSINHLSVLAPHKSTQEIVHDMIKKEVTNTLSVDEA